MMQATRPGTRISSRALLLGGFIGMATGAAATDYLSLDNEFGITRDFADISIAGQELLEARLFVDTVKNALPSEAPALQQVITNFLQDKIRLVTDPAEANYDLLLVLLRHRYALQNPKGEPAHGSVLLSICQVPHTDVIKDCENLTYYYFQDYPAAVILARVLGRWTKTVLR